MNTIQSDPPRSYDREIFPDSFLEMLGRWRLQKKDVVRRIGALTSRRGAGQGRDFWSHRPYTWGDDPRALDWYVYGRTGELFVKDFVREGFLHLSVCVDASGSMALGAHPKIRLALQAAAAISCLGLREGGSVSLWIAESNAVSGIPCFRGVRSFPEVLRFLSGREPAGEIDWERVFRGALDGPPSLLFICSDLLSADALPLLLKRAVRKRHRPTLLHIMAPEETDPDIRGAVCLHNVENGRKRHCRIDEKALRDHAENLRRFQDGWRKFCLESAIGYCFARSQDSVFRILDLLAPGAR